MIPVSPRFGFPPEKFPILLEALHPDTGAVVWSHTIALSEAPVPVYIPPLKEITGHPVVVRITFADGEVNVANLKKEPPPQ